MATNEERAFGEIRNRVGERIDYSCARGTSGSYDIVVIGHGVTANKDRPWAVALSAALAERGIASLRMSFAGNGASEGKFEQATVSKEAEDLASVLDVLDGWRITYAGHSMGAAVGAIVASRDPRIRYLVSLGGMVATAEFAQRKFGALTPGRDVMWDKPECPLSQAFMDDMAAIGSTVERGAEIEVPWLLVHGDADEVVPPRDSQDIAARAGDSARVELLAGADHVFSGDAAEIMARCVADWLSSQFEKV